MYSLGHSTHDLDVLVELCAGAGIRLICDIRRFPRSRRHPQFVREHLERELPGHGMEYVWLGEALGGFRDGGYEEWMMTDTFNEGRVELERLAMTRTLAFMCSEGSPDRCHRRFVARELAERGHGIGHLLPRGEIVWEQPPLELRGR